MRTIPKFIITIAIGTAVAALIFAYSAQTYAFDINACYSKCPCAMGAVQACADCKQKCDDQYWEAFDKESEN